VKDFDIPSVEWDIQNADTMMVHEFDGRMDYVVGNPPYVRVHNLNTNLSRVKRYMFCDGGMTDLYLVFYEIGLTMLAKRGRLCYITPSSWINSMAGKNMREHFRYSGCLKGIIDLQHFQPFNATTYTAICLLENSWNCDKFSYSVYDSPKTIRHIDDLKYEDAFFDGALYLGDKQTLQSFKSIKTAKVPSFVKVKNGFATLADNVFISNAFPFDSMTIPVIKASTGKWRKAFYPYDKYGKPLSRNEIFANKRIAEYLEQHKKLLLKGRNEVSCPNWYLYGRTQALKDVWTNKYSINTVVRDVSSIKFNVVPNGMGVYSGLYIISDVSEESLRTALLSDDFIKYISVLKKYKSGGYYTFNSKELKQFLDFKLATMSPVQHKSANCVQQFFNLH
jgi:adenine-specific DNA-methyltransferase